MSNTRSQQYLPVQLWGIIIRIQIQISGEIAGSGSDPDPAGSNISGSGSDPDPAGSEVGSGKYWPDPQMYIVHCT